MNKAKSIISFLQPVKVHDSITTFDELDMVLKLTPPYTLLSLDFFENALQYFSAANMLSYGNWVLVGVWKGGGALFLKALMDDLKIEQPLYLLDTFGKIPVGALQHDKDSKFADYYSLGKNHEVNNYQKDVELLFEEHNLNKAVNFISCNIINMQKHELPDNIAFIHLDVDFYEPTFSALALFYDKVIAGGMIIIDDYYMELLNCKEAVDDFFKTKNIDLNTIGKKFSTFSILIIKP